MQTETVYGSPTSTSTGPHDPARRDHPRALRPSRTRSTTCVTWPSSRTVTDPHRHVRAGHGHLPEHHHQSASPRRGSHDRPKGAGVGGRLGGGADRALDEIARTLGTW